MEFALISIQYVLHILFLIALWLRLKFGFSWVVVFCLLWPSDIMILMNRCKQSFRTYASVTPNNTSYRIYCSFLDFIGFVLSKILLLLCLTIWSSKSFAIFSLLIPLVGTSCITTIIRCKKFPPCGSREWLTG